MAKPWPRYFDDSTGIGWILTRLDGSTERVYLLRDVDDSVGQGGASSAETVDDHAVGDVLGAVDAAF